MQAAPTAATDYKGHNYIGHNYIGHNCRYDTRVLHAGSANSSDRRRILLVISAQAITIYAITISAITMSATGHIGHTYTKPHL